MGKRTLEVSRCCTLRWVCGICCTKVTKHTCKGIHLDYNNQGRRHKSKTGVSVAHQKLFNVFQNFTLKRNCNQWLLLGCAHTPSRSFFLAVFRKVWSSNGLTPTFRVGTPFGKSSIRHWTNVANQSYSVCVWFTTVIVTKLTQAHCGRRSR